MAKLSARGAHKVASARKIISCPDTGREVRIVIALRSDGKVLKRFDHPHEYGRTGWSCGGYSVAGALPARNGKSSRERFERYASEQGYTLDIN